MSTNPVFTDGCVKNTLPSQNYATINGSVSYVAGKGRFGLPGLQCTAGLFSSAAVLFPSNPVTALAAFAVQLSQLPASGAVGVWSCDDANANNQQVTLGWLPTGQLQFYRGNTAGTAIGSPSVQSFPPNSIIQLQVKVTVDPAAGIAQCRLNGAATPILTFSGNTRNTANTLFSRQTLGGTGTTAVTEWFSDIMLFDGGGSAPNDFVGNKRVYTLLDIADSATGGLNQFSTQPNQAAGSHFVNINQTPPPGDTSYNYDSVVNDRESYQIGALPAGATGVVGVNVWANMRIDDASPHTVSITSRSGGVDSVGPALNIAQTYTYYPFFQAVDPATGVAWLGANVGGLTKGEIGVKLIS